MSTRYTVAKLKKVRYHQKIMREFYDTYHEGFLVAVGSPLTKSTGGTYAILEKHELEGIYYFVIQGKNQRVYLAKVIYNGRATLKIIAKSSDEYKINAKVFNGWISLAKTKRQDEIIAFFIQYKRRYKPVSVRSSIDERGVTVYKYIAKYIYSDSYYFIVKTEQNKYFVAKIVWFGSPRLVKVSEKEFAKMRNIFEAWLKDAK